MNNQIDPKTGQNFAAITRSFISQCSAVLGKATSIPPAWSRRIARFLYGSSGEPEEQAKTAHTFQSQFVPSSSKKIALITRPLRGVQEKGLSKQEIDAFRMKAITLLKTHGIRFKSIADQLQIVKHTPIQAVAEASIVSLSQVFHTFPGEMIELRGSFKREAGGRSYSIPIPDSFRLTPRSMQTGFPHPSQYNGWALSDALISPSPRQNHPLLKGLLKKKRTIAEALHPDGNLILRAKELLQQKGEAFERDRDQLLDLHCQLCLAILNAAPANIIPEGAQEAITQFYDMLKKIPNVYEYLSFVNNWIVDFFISQPFAKLALKEKEEEASKAFEEETALSINRLKEQITHSHIDEEKRALAYILCMGQLLGNPAQYIILHDRSEFPQLLSDYELRIQASAYKQLQEFILELEEPNRDLNLAGQLKGDIALFSNGQGTYFMLEC